MISSPIENKKRALARAAAEAVLGELPIAGALIRIYQETHPAAFKKQIEGWMREISDHVNGHEARLESLATLLETSIKISDAAATVAISLCRLSESGMTDPISFDEIVVKTPGVATKEIELALYELQELNYLVTKHGLLRIRPTLDLFRAFDPTVHGTSPDDDAEQLARAVLADPALCGVYRLHARIAWSRRRFNPALAYMLTFVDDRMISREIQADYPTTSFSLDGSSEFRLRRLIGE